METCYFDLYREVLLETIRIFRDPSYTSRIDRAQEIDALREMLQIDSHYLDVMRPVPAEMTYLLQQLNRIKPHVLKQDVVKMGLAISEKAGRTAVAYEPFPDLPFWLEFDHMAIGDPAIHFVAILAIPDFLDSDIIWVQLITMENIQRSKELYFHRATGRWEYEQLGRCSSTRCSVAAYTREGQPYRLTQEDVPWMHRGCTCAAAGYTWAQHVNTFNHILKYQGSPFQKETIIREVPRPYAHPKTRAEMDANEHAYRSDVVMVSLSEQVEVSLRSPLAARGSHKTSNEMEMVNIEGSWRVLVPGSGKPWKSLQIYYVDEYPRRKR